MAGKSNLEHTALFIFFFVGSRAAVSEKNDIFAFVNIGIVSDYSVFCEFCFFI